MTRIHVRAARQPWRQRGVADALRACLIAGLAVLLFLGGASAQTPSSAVLVGHVRSAEGVAVPDARVILSETTTGFLRSVRSDRYGRFAFRLLQPGDYTVTAEKLGYRPQHVAVIRLLPGRSQSVELSIARAEPPILSMDSVSFDARVEWSRAGVARWFGPLELEAPRDRAVDGELASLATSDAISWEGLPGSLARDGTEGFSFGDVVAPALGGASGDEGSLRRLGGAELVELNTDVQWDGGAVPSLLTWRRRGARDWSLRSWTSGSDPEAALGFFSADESYAFDRFQAGAEVGGPIVRDTAVFVLGGEWRRHAQIEPRAWRIDEAAGARIASGARGADLQLLALTLPRVSEHDEIAAWGRFDWRLAANHDFGGFADFRMSRGDDIPTLRATPAAVSMDELDIVAGGTLRSVIAERFANELRIGFARTSHEAPLPGSSEATVFADVTLPYTTVVGGSLLFGANPFLPSLVERSALRLEQALQVSLGSHTLKLGLAVDWDSYDQEHGFARLGAFTFGDAAGFADGVGDFVQTVGPAPISSLSVLETGAFVQDTWRPAPGVELLFGVRYSDERLPSDGVQASAPWRALTGIDTQPEEERVGQLSPRLGFLWNVRDEGRWLVRAGFGVYHDDVPAALLGERQIQDGTQRVRRFSGELGAWPDVPDSTLAESSGRLLTFFGPDFRPPRSTRASVGLSRVGALSMHLSGSYRMTDFLPARRDLNRMPRALARDQHGRPIFAELRQQGALVAAVPGTNRRFAEFDVVSAVEASAFSEYWGVTAMIERRVAEHVRLAATYTYSRTIDNWVGYGSAFAPDAFAPQLADSASGTAWSEGTSSFDVPHRASVAADVELPLPLSPSVGLVYQMMSSLPFTPGFQPGVDVNGDYAANDPAFVDGAVEGMPALLEEWECLREQAGTFAERNSCRGDPVHALDARLGIRFDDARFGRARLYVDALNLITNNAAAPDAALFIVDAGQELSTDAGVTSIPLEANPRFGKPLRSVDAGRVFRVGLEVSF